MRVDQQNEAPLPKRDPKVNREAQDLKTRLDQDRKTKQKKEKPRHEIVRYDQDNMKECFRERLVMTLNIAELTSEETWKLGTFKGILKSEWNKVRHVVYHSKEEPTCPICLETSFTAPQMTSCGHVFCWLCIFMHSQKSLKAVFCPVCNQAYEIEHIVTCRPIYNRSFEELQQNKVRFALKGRREGDNRIYDYDNLVENINFSRVVRAFPETILAIFEKERKEVEYYMTTCEDELMQESIKKILSISGIKISKVRDLLMKKEPHGHHRRDRVENGYIYSVLDKREKNKLTTFYQEHSGRMIFLHPICDKYIRKSTAQLPLILQEEIIEWEDTQYSFDLLKYSQISHLTVNQEIDLVIINIEPLLEDEGLKVEFRGQLEMFKKRRREEMERQEKQSVRLSAQFKKIQKIKKQRQIIEQSEFKDIQIPGPLDTKQIQNPSLFPSLIETKSLPGHQQIQKPNSKRGEELYGDDDDSDEIIEDEYDIPLFNIRKESDPNSSINIPSFLQSSKSEDIRSCTSEERAGGKRKKKEKYVNVTGLFFNAGNTGASI